MRKNGLRLLALLFVAWSMSSLAPQRQASAQPAAACVCNIDCKVGTKCCATDVNGQCVVRCIPEKSTCTTGCHPCTLDCKDGKHCCVGLSKRGTCTYTCVSEKTPCKPACVCTLDCVRGEHCCTGVDAAGKCTQTCVPKGKACPA